MIGKGALKGVGGVKGAWVEVRGRDWPGGGGGGLAVPIFLWH